MHAMVLSDLVCLSIFFLVCIYTSFRSGKIYLYLAPLSILGTLLYLILTVSSRGDALVYYESGRYLDSAGNIYRFGTEFVKTLSFLVQSVLPVSIFGLGTLFVSIRMISVPRLIGEYNERLFIILVLTSPSIVFWGGLLSKDLLCIIAAMISISAFISYSIGKRYLYIIMITISLIVALFVRPYILPIILVPHFLVICYDSLGILRRGLINRSLVFGSFMTISIFLLLFLGSYFSIRYISGGTSISGLVERLEEGRNYFEKYSGSYVNYSIPEKVFLLFSPLLFRVNNALSLIASINSAVYFIFLIFLYRGALKSGNEIDKRICIFTLSAIIVWTIIYSSNVNMGIIERMKAQVTPFLFMLMSHLSFICRRPRDRCMDHSLDPMGARR